MKAIIVQAPAWTVETAPYNLALLKAVSKQHGHQLICFDLNLKFYKSLPASEAAIIYGNPTSWYNDEYVHRIIAMHPEFLDNCVKELANTQARLIGFTITGLSKVFSIEMAKRLKEIDKQKIIIFGGPGCFKTEYGDNLLKDNLFIDAVCYLEGEQVLPAILEMIEKDGKLTSLPGIAFRNQKQEIVKCPDNDQAVDLNELPFADYSDFNLSEYSTKELPISVSRGCINRCKFCSEAVVWKKFRFRTAKSIFEEMRYQLERHPRVESFYFNSSLINGDLESLRNLCDLIIQSKMKVQWGGQAAIREGMTKELIYKMKKAGLTHVSYGLESASLNVLKKMGKPFTPKLAQKVIQATNQAGVRTDVNIVIGFPGENEEDVLETASFLRRNNKYIETIFFHPLILSKGSYLYVNRKQLGLHFKNEYDLNSWYTGENLNTSEKRLEILNFYSNYLSRLDGGFFAMADYYLLAGEEKFEEKDYSGALAYFLKAKNHNKNTHIENIISKKLALVTQLVNSK